jgi:hypothetical protein
VVGVPVCSHLTLLPSPFTQVVRLLPRVVAMAASARLVVSWYRREHVLSYSFLLICSSVLEATFGITPVLSYDPAIIAF